MNWRMRESYFQGCQKLSSASVSATSHRGHTSTVNMADIFHALLACLTPSLVYRNSVVSHDSVSLESMLEENIRVIFVTSHDDLPDFLLVDIIRRLPLESIFRSKCIFKKWLSLISHPHFACSYASWNPSVTQPLALFYVSSILKLGHPCDVGPYCPFFGSDSMDFPINVFKTKLRQRQRGTFSLQLMGSGRDLLLFSGLSNTYDTSTFCICNPLTFEWFTPPQFKGHGIRYLEVGFMVEEDGTFRVVQIIPHQPIHLPVFLFFILRRVNGA